MKHHSFKLTPAQVFSDGRNGTQPGYFEMFRQICRAKDWPADTAHRRLWHEIAGLGPCSAKDIDRMKGFDALKSAWLAIVRPDDLNAQIKMENMPRIRLMHAIYSKANEQYIEALRNSARFAGKSFDQMTELELEQFRNTLCARVSAANRSGDFAAPAPAAKQPF